MLLVLLVPAPEINFDAEEEAKADGDVEDELPALLLVLLLLLDSAEVPDAEIEEEAAELPRFTHE